MESRKAKFQIDFLSKRAQFGSLSMLLVIGSLVLIGAIGPNYGIDFEGGTNIIVRFTEDIDDDELRSAMIDLGFDDASVQRFGSEGDFQYLVQTAAVTSVSPERQTEIGETLTGEFGDGTEYEFDAASGDRLYVQVPTSAYVSDGSGEGADTEVPPEVLAEMAEVLSGRIGDTLEGIGMEGTSVSRFGNPVDRRFMVRVQALQASVRDGLAESFTDRFESVERVETVGPRVGEQLRNDGIRAVLIALVFILVYIAIRFDFRYGPGAVVALAHDVLITIGIFVIIQEEISLPIVAALLTIVGYSLNDTIVNFDRIRENLQLVGNSTKNLDSLVNRSLNECLSRTLLTSVTTLIAVMAIFILGGGLIKSFALAMIIGVVVGTYSSIFVASPIMILTTRWMEGRQREPAPVKSDS